MRLLGLFSAGAMVLGLLLFSSLQWALPFALWWGGFAGMCVAAFGAGLTEP
jgi:hypothetical protein